MTKHSKTFHLHGGNTFSSIEEFAKHLKTMSTDVYKHHVSPLKNDFANWVRDSHNNSALAKKLEKKLDKVEMELEVLRHLVFEEKKPKRSSPSKKK